FRMLSSCGNDKQVIFTVVIKVFYNSRHIFIQGILGNGLEVSLAKAAEDLKKNLGRLRIGSAKENIIPAIAIQIFNGHCGTSVRNLVGDKLLAVKVYVP